MGKVLQVASFSYAEVKFITGDIGYLVVLWLGMLPLLIPCFLGRFQVREAVKTAQLRVKTKQENVSGVQLPAFEMNIDGQNGILSLPT